MTAWRQIERETGAELYLAVGNLAYTALDEQPHLDAWRRSAARSGPTSSCWTRPTLRARYPQFQLAKRAILERDAGFVRASACIEALRVVAERAGATILPEREIVAIDLDGPRGGRARRPAASGSRASAPSWRWAAGRSGCCPSLRTC